MSAISSSPIERGGRLGYLPGLDGLRAVAVSAVFLFHADVVPGGFLGVDVFFVISGFLITALAIGEIERTGTLSLSQFWSRRARRLLPALYVLCTGVVAWALIDGVPERLGRDVFATLAYVANWARLGEGYEYFAAYDEPSLLEHTWSLAVEEQFYLVWPLVLVAAVAVARRMSWSPRVTIGAVASVAAVSSTTWSWWLAGTERAQLNRLYFGTDTRAVGLAVGCVAGCVLAQGARTGRRQIGAGATAAAMLGFLTLTMMTLTVDGSETWLYGPGFAAAAVASLAVVNAAAGTGVVQRVLAIGPLAAMGRVSYGVYLWHWPVIVVLDEERTGWSGLPLGAVWVVVTGLLVWASWVLVEQRAPLPTMTRPSLGLAYTGVAVAVAIAAIGVTRLDGTGDDVVVAAPPILQQVEPPAVTDPAPVDPANATADPAPTTAGAIPPSAAGDVGGDAAPRTAPPVDRPLRLLVLGDSIAESLKQPGPLTVDGIEVAVTNRSIIACPVTWEGRWAFDDGRLIGDPPECDGDDRFSADVAEVDPDLILLMFGWPGTISGRELDDGTVVAPCEPGFDVRFADEFRRLVDRFDDRAAVVVATVAPPTKYRDIAQSDRPGCLNRVIRDGGFNVFDFGEWLCPGADCATAVPLMRDTVHFADTPEVRAQVWPAVISQVLDAGGY
jgi:peptidoglycan/LPS O-acetylase OafA/YrhL